MEEAGVPTPKSATFTDLETARAYVEQQGAPIVIKADGLASGKGVIVAETLLDALTAVGFCLVLAHAALRQLTSNVLAMGGSDGHRPIVHFDDDVGLVA